MAADDKASCMRQRFVMLIETATVETLRRSISGSRLQDGVLAGIVQRGAETHGGQITCTGAYYL
jgi:hypothetical protein